MNNDKIEHHVFKTQKTPKQTVKKTKKYISFWIETITDFRGTWHEMVRFYWKDINKKK